ncbi:MAG: TraR/DksA C4-type zinc finger protein [Gammaproteobacteria bacterium]
MASHLKSQAIMGLKRRLQQRATELKKQIQQELLASNDQRFIDLAGQVHDVEEEAFADLLVDLNLASIDRHVLELQEIDAALKRMAANEYGLCTDCGQSIAARRLEAYPASQRCISCQTAHEKQQASNGQPSL